MLYKLNHKFFEPHNCGLPNVYTLTKMGFLLFCFSSPRHQLPTFLSYYYPLQFVHEGNWGSERARDAQGHITSQWRSWDLNPMPNLTPLLISFCHGTPVCKESKRCPHHRALCTPAWSSAHSHPRTGEQNPRMTNSSRTVQIHWTIKTSLQQARTEKAMCKN